MKTELVGTPRLWQQMIPHPLSRLTEYGAGIDVDALAEHMKKFGYDQDEAIIIFERMILDGRHKHAAAIKAGVVPTFRAFTGKNAAAYVQKKLFRQHLTVAERARLAATLVNVKAGDNQHADSANGEPAVTVAEAARAAGVSERSVQRARSKATKTDKPPRTTKRSKSTPENPGKTETKEVVTNGTTTMNDKEGHKLPAQLTESFANLEKFEELDSLCRSLQKQMDELSRLPGGEQLKRFLVPTGDEKKTINKSEHLQRLKADLKGTRPHSVCPYCSGKGAKDCKGCAGNGWVTATTWKDTPENIKDKL